MKRYTLKYEVYIEVEAESYTDAKFEGADMLAEASKACPMEWYFNECTYECEIEEEEE